MKIVGDLLLLAATDLSNHLACAHVTTLDVSVARGERGAPKPSWAQAKQLQELGEDHERRYLAWLRNKGLRVESLEEVLSEAAREKRTLELMREGVDVIYQGALRLERWLGRPDILRRVRDEDDTGARGSAKSKGARRYEAYDCKLARETRATAIVQLSLYSEMIAEAMRGIGGATPVNMHVVRPGDGEPFVAEPYRVAEYAAYYRTVKKRLVAASGALVSAGADAEATAALGATYPEPCSHCDVCRWFQDCDKQRHDDDHLSLVAGIRSSQIDDLEENKISKVAQLAEMALPLTWKQERGSRDGIVRVREQARVQVAGRVAQKPVHELIEPVTAGFGFCKLPEPCAGDIYLDLEGDPFAAGGRMEYLFGFSWRDAKGKLHYEKRWALTREEEREAFTWLVDEIVRRRAKHPAMHAYHFGGYESGALKHLMGYYATREEEVDSFLRAGVLVDLHQVFKQAVRASVEDYGLKKLEAFYGYTRELKLDAARAALHNVERRLELGRGVDAITDAMKRDVEIYNADDCYSTAALHRWIEERRDELVAGGTAVARFVNREEETQENLTEWLTRVEAVVVALTEGIPADRDEWTDEHRAKWLMAQLVDWHRREDKSSYWEMHRLKDLEPKDLVDERAGLSGLTHTGFVGREKKSVVHEYSFDEQDSDVDVGDDVYCRHATKDKEQSIGEVLAIDYKLRLIKIKKTGDAATMHPPAIFAWDAPIRNQAQRESLMAIAEWIAANNVDAGGEHLRDHRAARDLLLRHAPRLARKNKLVQRATEKPFTTAIRVVNSLDSSTFAIQGPPGSGKTFTGARMICDLVKRGKKIGVTATGHKVIRKLLEDTVDAACEAEISAGVAAAHVERYGENTHEGVKIVKDSEDALTALTRGKFNVLGGTAWLWSREDAIGSVDVLFVDEAGQMSLADVMAVSRAARSIVLLGDPQQLDRPIKGSHPDGAEVSAMTHLLAERKTIASEKGFLMPETWRLHKNICTFTSELFYEDRLGANEIANSRVIGGHPWMNGAGLYFVPVSHAGNHNASNEEIDAIVKIVASVLRDGVTWSPELGRTRALTAEDVLIVAPYNKQVDQLRARLAARWSAPEVRVGTVDKFQGQEAPVAIYSLATSSPELAPRGMEFLYSLNRLNVATSRAQTASVLVGSPGLFAPECKTPRQMQLANAFCRFLEMANWVDVSEL
jgi:predicted RecB family nuclease